MRRLLLRTRARLRDAVKPAGEAAIGALTIGLLRATRYFDPIKTANLFGRIAQSIGPRLREQRIGHANLTAAFPEKPPEEIDRILAGVWDNLGRMGAEFAPHRRQQLHADTDAQERRAALDHLFPQRFDHAGHRGQALHAIGKGAHARQHDALGRAHLVRVGGGDDLVAVRFGSARQGPRRRGEIAGAIIDQRHAGHGKPCEIAGSIAGCGLLVEAPRSAFPSARSAWRGRYP